MKRVGVKWEQESRGPKQIFREADKRLEARAVTQSYFRDKFFPPNSLEPSFAKLGYTLESLAGGFQNHNLDFTQSN